jgi:hypothetical protein
MQYLISLILYIVLPIPAYANNTVSQCKVGSVTTFSNTMLRQT